jgi:eukaryotic-like serine/threonine-protein kinase
MASSKSDIAPGRDPLLGQVLGERYQLRRRLGQGGGGLVYEAEHIPLGHRVALKVLQPQASESPEATERFRREALALSRLRHPYALKLYDYGETQEGIPWIAMEWLEGETLAERLRRQGALPPGEVIALLGQLCEVLAEAHEKGIIHRDLKPQNIMLVPLLSGGGSLAKLLDFGLSAVLFEISMTSPELVSGTPRYMAPEQWEGLASSDARSDIYSLGVIAYQCLSGRTPFEADSPLAWLKKHQQEEPRDLAEAMAGRPLPEGLRAVVMRALAKAPAARQQSVAELRRELTAGSQEPAAPGRAAQGTRLRWGQLLAAGVPLILLGYLIPRPAAQASGRAPCAEAPIRQDASTVPGSLPGAPPAPPPWSAPLLTEGTKGPASDPGVEGISSEKESAPQVRKPEASARPKHLPEKAPASLQGILLNPFSPGGSGLGK